MKLPSSYKRTSAWTLTETLVVVAVVVTLALVFFPWHRKIHRKLTGNSNSWKINCINNLKMDALAFMLWAGDNNDKFPMDVPTRAGGAMESAAAGNAVAAFQVMSNELSTTKILICPADDSHVAAPNFKKLSRDNISYFVGLKASRDNPGSFLAGDDNFEVNGAPVKSGVTDLLPGTPVAWNNKRHPLSGNIALCDGTVQVMNQDLLTSTLQETGGGTNRIAIP